jgi:hypothetical protein
MNFTITFTEKELETVLICLAEQPYKIAAPVIQKLQVEIKKTQQAEINKPVPTVEQD